MANHVYGVDFGTNTIKIYDGNTKRFLKEHNLIAIKGKDTLYSYGDLAYEMFEKTPKEIRVDAPVKDGAIANIKEMSMLFECLFEKINFPKKKRGGDFCVAVPTNISDVEKRAFYDLISDSRIKTKDIVAVEKSLADIVGSGLDVFSTDGKMLIDFGADTTEITVSSQGGIVLNKLFRLGGNDMDHAIAYVLRKQFRIVIGLKSAEMLKLTLANAMPDDDSFQEMQVFGIDSISGLPNKKTISSELINNIILMILKQITDEIKSVLDRTPPELAADIHENGIYITGGASQIPNLDLLLEKSLSIPVHKVNDPESSVINGLAEILDNPSYMDLLYTPREEED